MTGSFVNLVKPYQKHTAHLSQGCMMLMSFPFPSFPKYYETNKSTLGPLISLALKNCYTYTKLTHKSLTS